MGLLTATANIGKQSRVDYLAVDTEESELGGRRRFKRNKDKKYLSIQNKTDSHLRRQS